MKKKVVIVESPAKARTIERYLGGEYEVLSSMGHVRDLPKTKLSVDIEKDFKPHFIIKNRKVISNLKANTKEAERVYLATDNDREGEAIAYDLYEVLNKGDGKKKKYVRIIFNEVTKKAILEAIKQPGEIDLNKVEAQRARRILDRLVGYLVSPLLSKSISGSKSEGLSAGRVQSVALRLITEREQEIQGFTPQEYWTVTADFGDFQAKLKSYRGKKVQICDKDEAERIANDLREKDFIVAKIKEEKHSRTPPPPFITSTLQRAASSWLKFSPKKTMMIAQQLYEGVNLEEGREGLITYMRTDSTRVSPQAQQELRKFIPREYGESYLHPKPKVFKKKGKAQDAHEAIRPTQLLRFPSKVKGFLNRDQYRLYKLIWERFVATQMADATYLRRKVEIRAREYIFAAQSTSLLFDGFLAVLKLAPLKDEGVKIPSLREGFSLPRPKILTEQHFTEPPKRYSEASLVEALEEKGVGRPSTYAKIVSTIQERGYVVREKGILKPTLLGFIATDFLKEYFPLTTSEDFTAQMEENLDQIGDGKLSRLEVLSSFYEPFSKLLRLTEESLQKQGFHILTNIQCNRCGAPMEVRYWKGSSYLSCSSYPTCKNTFNLVEYKYNYSSKKAFLKIKKDSRTCPVCGAPMELKQSKYGRFYGCTNYPECKATEPIYLDVPCPLCGGRLKQRRSKKHNKTFYGCSNYPECKFAVWKKPIRICPHCEKGVLISKGEKIKCTNCGHIADEDLSV